MAQDKAEDAGGLSPAKDDNAALRYFNRRTLPIFKCVDYKNRPREPLRSRGLFGRKSMRGPGQRCPASFLASAWACRRTWWST